MWFKECTDVVSRMYIYGLKNVQIWFQECRDVVSRMERYDFKNV